MVVIAGDDLVGKPAYLRQALGRIGPVTYGVAQAKNVLDAFLFDVGQHRGQGFMVAMYV